VTVNLTRIYTKRGDAGQTHLGDMSRVSKMHPRVEAYGTVDELNSNVGFALLAHGMPAQLTEWLRRIQNDLLDLGADLCVPEPRDEKAAARERLRITPAYVQWLEQALDQANEKLPRLRSFVIPGGTDASARLHLCRTVCRRAERRVLAVEDANPEVVRYLNRLSDLLFVLARTANEEAESGGAEPLWQPGAHEAGERS
jgi:cob(I)alamin adenosyltransferase